VELNKKRDDVISRRMNSTMSVDDGEEEEEEEEEKEEKRLSAVPSLFPPSLLPQVTFPFRPFLSYPRVYPSR
jgi:hypothetical protein